jgi:hypothetical protein
MEGIGSIFFSSQDRSRSGRALTAKRIVVGFFRVAVSGSAVTRDERYRYASDGDTQKGV